MCDYSLSNVKSRPAKVGDKLVTKNYGTGTTGFACADDLVDDSFYGDPVAICLLPGTELAFAEPVKTNNHSMWPWGGKQSKFTTAIFRQINKDKVAAHHDALEFPDGQNMLLTLLESGQHATVLQLPAAPKSEAEAKDQKRVAAVG